MNKADTISETRRIPSSGPARIRAADSSGSRIARRTPALLAALGCGAALWLLAAVVSSAPATELVSRGAGWQFHDGMAEASSPDLTAWRAVTFDDGAWTNLPSPFWYGDVLAGGTQLTNMQSRYSCFFLRRTFVLTNLAEAAALRLGALVDDGFVAWINGTEVARVNVGPGAPTISTFATNVAEPVPFVTYAVPSPTSSYLSVGTNVLAVQVFNTTLASSDIGFDASLVGYSLESVPPTILGQTPAPGVVNSLTAITVNFSEAVTGVNATDLLLNGFPADTVSGGPASFTFQFAQLAYGTIAVTWAAAHGIADWALPANAFNSNGPGATWSYDLVDNTPPTLAFTFPATGAIMHDSSVVEVTFSEAVAGVDAADLLVNNVPATNLWAVTPSQYRFEFSPAATGLVEIAWASGHDIHDLASPSNAFAGAGWTYTVNPNEPPPRVVISEFMAANKATLRDEDGDYSDWIELYNAGAIAVNLDGWGLTDNAASPFKWRFPGVVLLPNEYLVVFASNKDRTNVTGRLHTNFQLNKDGEYLGLITPWGAVASAFAPVFPPQQNDVSFGRDRVNADLTGYYFTPTPGAANSTRGAGFGPEVAFSVTGRAFASSFSIVLTTPTDTNSVIRYVLVTNAVSATVTNVPDSNSPLYTVPIPIQRTMQVRARAFPNTANLFPGPARTESYLQLNANLVNYTSDLPVIVMDTIGPAAFTTGVPAPWQPVMFALFEPRLGVTSLTNAPVVMHRGGAHLRGRSTRGSPKPSYALELWDEYNDDDSVKLLDLPAESDWVLYAFTSNDGSLMHNALTYEMSREAGRYAARTRYVEAFINTGGSALSLPSGYTSPNYWGLFLLTEKIKGDKDRVDIDQLEPENTNAPAITGGYLLKYETPAPSGEALLNAGNLPGITFVEPDGIQMQAPQRAPQVAYISNYLNVFFAALTSPNWTNPVTGYAAWLDVDAAIDHHLLNTFTFNADGLRLSAYFHKPRDARLVMGPVWDHDIALGGGRGGDLRMFNPFFWSVPDVPAPGGTDFFWPNQHFTNPWYSRLFQDPDFFQRWIDRYQELRASVLSTNNLFALVDYFSGQIRQAEPRQRQRWADGSYSDPSPRNGTVSSGGYSHTFPGTYQGEVDFQKRWLADRALFMDTNFLARPQLSASGGPVASGYRLLVTANTLESNSLVYFTLDGTDPRLSGGAISPTALVNTQIARVTITNNVRVFARNYNANHRNLTGTIRTNPPLSSPWSGPIADTFYVSRSPLVVTEIHYHPAPPPPGNTNDADNFEFVELKNTGPAPFSLAGFRFTAGIEFTFTATNAVTVLAPDATVLLVRSLAAFRSRYPGVTNIAGEFTGTLDNAGERLVLVGPVGEPVFDFSYNDAWYRATDGLGFSLIAMNELAPPDTWSDQAHWRPSAQPGGSPGVTDPAPPVLPPITVNEVLSASMLPDVDWIELFNPTATNVDIGGWYLSDDPQTPQKFRIPAGTNIAAGGFVVFTEYEFNPGGLGFALGADGDEVWLFSADAGGQLTGYAHGFSFGTAERGVTFGRHVTSTGAEHFVPQSAATPGASNALPRVGPVVVSEIMFHPPDAGTNDNTLSEFVELLNIAATNVPLYDLAAPTNTWRFRDAVDFDFPAGITLTPGARLLVVGFDPAFEPASLAAFRATYALGTNTPILGPWSGKLDNSEDILELKAPNPPLGTNLSWFNVEQIHYHNDAPWPGADGDSTSLQLRVADAYGNDPANWAAATPTPGAAWPGGQPPVILTQPASQTVFAAQTVTFSITATSALPWRAQWRWNGTVLSGATNTTLTLSNAQPAQAGSYSIVVFNAAGSAVSSNALLAVTPGPVIVQQPQDVSSKTGSNVTFSVIAQGNGVLTYQWRWNGTNLAGGTNATLLLTNLQPTQSGAYAVLVSDELGSLLSAAATLTIASPPLVVSQPQSTNVLEGQTVFLSVGVLGTPPLSFKWRRNNITQAGQTSATVILTNVAAAPAANWNVIVTNLSGSTTSQIAVVTVWADFDHDGLPDWWAQRYFGHTNGQAGDLSRPGDDPDGDRMLNWQEYTAGTDPTNRFSFLQLGASTVASSARLAFEAVSNRTYTVQFRDTLATAPWQPLTNLPASPTNRIEIVSDSAVWTNRFYRLVTPQLP